MKAVEKLVRDADEWNQRIGLLGSLLVDRFKDDRSPASLQEALDFVRLGISASNARLKVLRGRRVRRRALIKARRGRKKALGRLIQAHDVLIKRQVFQYEKRRRILRQIADAFAWVALSRTPRARALLFRAQTHQPPEEMGLAGHLLVQGAAHECGDFLVIENDLTRCLGVGDLTVVPISGPSARPIAIEIKTSGDSLELGAELDVRMSLVETNDPADQEVMERFKECLGIALTETITSPELETGQMLRFFEDTQRAEHQRRRVRDKMEAPPAEWTSAIRVLERAKPGYPAFDWIEEGQVVFAIRYVDDPTQFAADFRLVQERVASLLGATDEHPIKVTTNNDIEEHDVSSTIVLPTALWMIPASQRAMILNNDLYFGSFLDMAVLQRLLQVEGIALKEEDGEWTLTSGGETLRMDRLERMRVVEAATFGGHRLSRLAESIAETLKRTMQREGSG